MRKIYFQLIFCCSLFIAHSSFSQSGWVIQYAQNGSHIISVSTLSNGTIFALNYSGVIHKSTNYGVNWITNISNLQYQSCDIKFVNEFTGFYAGLSVKKTTNEGINWQNCSVSPYGIYYTNFSFLNENTGWVCYDWMMHDIEHGYIAKTTNAGINWQERDVFTYLYPLSVHFVDSLTGYIAGMYNYSLGIMFKTTNGGSTFEQLGDYSYGIKKIFFVNASTGWFVAGNGVIKKTTNGGINWSLQNSGVNVQLNSCWFANSMTGYVCGQSGIILYTTNGGVNWIQQYSSVSFNLNAMNFINLYSGWIGGGNNYVSGNILFTNSGGINVRTINKEIPQNFSLSQNYPNPFNPSTNIKFQIASVLSSPHALGGDLVTLKVFDILGKEIATLVNEKLQPGEYEVTFDGTNIPSGIYFYTLSTDGFKETKKMLIIK